MGDPELSAFKKALKEAKKHVGNIKSKIGPEAYDENPNNWAATRRVVERFLDGNNRVLGELTLFETPWPGYPRREVWKDTHRTISILLDMYDEHREKLEKLEKPKRPSNVRTLDDFVPEVAGKDVINKETVRALRYAFLLFLVHHYAKEKHWGKAIKLALEDVKKAGIPLEKLNLHTL